MKGKIAYISLLAFIYPALSLAEETRSNIQSTLYYNFIKQDNNKLMRFRPLSGWGEVRFPSSEQPEDRYNFILEGAFLKELDIAKYENKLSLTAFAHLNYVIDSEKYDYNNKLRPSAGIKIGYFPISNIVIEAGTKYEWDRRITTDRTLEGTQIFLNGFASWDLNKIVKDGYSYPGFTWFNLRYPGAQDDDEEDNIIIEGALEQGIDWYKKNNTTVNSFVEIKYIFDREGYSWNNHMTYSLGSKFKIPVTKKIFMQPGAKYSFNRRFKTDNWEQKTLLFLNWYF
jgi:hypothetical protein